MTNVGLSGHSMMARIGHTHMNGRVYDPAIGRFMSVDPVFQAPTNSQSVNPYSYVMNNPLSFTDPTGYFLQGSYAEVCIDFTNCTGGENNRDAKGHLIKTVSQDTDVSKLKVGEVVKVNGEYAMALAGGGLAIAANGAILGSQGVSESLNKLATAADILSIATRPISVLVNSESGNIYSMGGTRLFSGLPAETSTLYGAGKNGIMSDATLARINDLLGQAVKQGYQLLDQYLAKGNVPEKWQDFVATDIYKTDWNTVPGFESGEDASCVPKCTGADWLDGISRFYAAAIVATGYDNLRGMTGLVLHEFEHSTSHNKKVVTDFMKYLRSQYGNDAQSQYDAIPHHARPNEDDAIKFSKEVMKLYPPN